MKEMADTVTTTVNYEFNKNNWRSSITFKVAMLVWGLIISTIVVLGLFNFINQRKIILERMNIEASNVSESIIQAHATSFFTDNYEAVTDYCSKLLASSGSIEFIVFTRIDGKSLIFKRGSWHFESLHGAWIKPAGYSEGRIGLTEFTAKESYQYTRPFILKDVNRGYVHLGLSLDSYDNAIRSLIWRSAMYSIFFIVIGFFVSNVFSRRLTKQIKELVKTTREIEAGNYKVKTNIVSNDELGYFAQTFNSMASAVSRSKYVLEATVHERTLELGITNKKLLEEVNKKKKAQTVLHQYAARLETLGEIYKGIISAATTNEVFYDTIENIHKKIFQFTTASLSFFDTEKYLVKVDSFSILNGQFIKTAKEYSFEEYSRSEKPANARYYLKEDLGAVKQKTLMEEILFREGRNAYITFPLHYQSVLIGEIIFGFDEKVSIENEIINTLVEVSHHISVAIMQLYLEERLKLHSEEIKRSLEEKEILLKEIHHRVKNNLQVISSLLFLQSANIKDEASLAVFKDSQMRVRSLALVHEKLYQSNNLSQIDFTGYIKNLIAHIRDSYGMSSNNIAVIYEMDKIFLSVDKAVPLGLVMNELLSNVFKYAFPDMGISDDRKNSILIKFTTADNNKLSLMVSDNGIGIPETHNIEESASMGLKLVTSLVSQIGGSLTIKHKDNTEFVIVFDKDEDFVNLESRSF